MKQNQYSINIENPCGQDWSLMRDNYAGKFCSVCEKSVIDFTKLSDDEVLKVLKQNNFEACGRFSEKQLNRPFSETKSKASFLPFFKILSGLLLFGVTEKALAVNKPLKTETFVGDRKYLPESISQKYSVENDSLKIVKGNVLYYEDNLALPGAFVSIKGTSINTQTDLNGNFTIEIPGNLLNEESITLVCSFVGVQPKEIKINPNRIPLEVKVELNEDYLTGIVVIEKYRKHWWQFWKKKYKY